MELVLIMHEESNIFVLDKKNGKNYYRSKDEYLARFKSSSDFFDSFFYRAMFELDARAKKELDPVYTEEDFAGLYEEEPVDVWQQE